LQSYGGEDECERLKVHEPKIMGDVGTQTELFLKDCHPHDLNAYDIDSMPDKIKYDIILNLRTEAELSEVSRHNTRGIDLYEKAIRLMRSVTLEE